MSDAYLGDIKLVGFNFAPRGWAMCEGQLLPIAQYQALFSLLGTFYGGDGRTTFALPDLRGRAAIHFGTGQGLSSHSQGQRGGQETFTLTEGQLPPHSHTATLHGETDLGNQQDMQNRMLGAHEGYVDPDASKQNRALHPDSVSVANAGQSQAVHHRGPYLALNYVICLEGVFPSRS